MKDVVEVTCYINKDESGKYYVLPKSPLDKTLINTFVDERGRYIVLRLMNRNTQKSYDQTKAFFGLLNNLFQVTNGYKPSSQELDDFYNDMLPVFFPVRESTTRKGEFVPKHWSELSKKEAMEVITRVMEELAEQLDMPDEVAANCKDIFEWIMEQKKEMSGEKEEEVKFEEKQSVSSIASAALEEDEIEIF